MIAENAANPAHPAAAAFNPANHHKFMANHQGRHSQ
jgi:hypothetical protein